MTGQLEDKAVLSKMSTVAVSGVSSEGKGVEIKKEAAATVTEAKKEAAVAVVAVVAAVAVAAAVEEEEEGDCDCEECQGGGWAEYEEEGGWIDELGVDDHDFY